MAPSAADLQQRRARGRAGIEMSEAIGELTAKRQKIAEDVAAEAVAAEAARQPVP